MKATLCRFAHIAVVLAEIAAHVRHRGEFTVVGQDLDDNADAAPAKAFIADVFVGIIGFAMTPTS